MGTRIEEGEGIELYEWKAVGKGGSIERKNEGRRSARGREKGGGSSSNALHTTSFNPVLDPGTGT